MTPITIAAIVGGVIITLIVVVYLSQYRRRAAEARRREMNALNDRKRQYQRLSESLPPGYLSPEVRRLLASQAIETLEALSNLDDPAAYRDEIVDWRAFAEGSPAAGNDRKPVSDAEVKEVRNLLKVLHRFIETQTRKGRLAKPVGLQQMELTRFNMAKILADAHGARSREALKNGKHRVAIHHLHDAISAYEAIKDSKLAQQAIQQYRAEMKNIEQEATRSLQEKNAQAPVSKTSTLSSQLDSMKEDDSWKKKQAYDD